MDLRTSPNLVRDDGTFWRSSWDELNPMAGIYNRDKRFYFRETALNPEWRWSTFWKPKWQLTGKIYESGSIDGFQLIKKTKEA